jgi:predicted ATPase/DNA-binding winged helix-turn-helix (wHTH) protein
MSSDGVANQPMPAIGGVSFRFDDFELDPAQRRLTRNGTLLAIGDRALDILVALVERAGEVVHKEALIARAWPNIFVHEDNLKVQVSALRRVLQDATREERLITSVVGRGYLFTGRLAAGPVPAERRAPAMVQPEEAVARPPTNLPQPPNALIGREAEILDLRRQVLAHHLVTITGPGGIGKTRLAIEFGWQALEMFADGVWLADLAGQPGSMVAAIAVALGAKLENEAKAHEALLAAIGAKRLLLILDNCEHQLAEVRALIATVLPAAPSLTLLLTSQEALHIAPERVLRLNPLTLPPASAMEIAQFGAVALLAERARNADQRFALNAGNSSDVVEICRRLDGLPLALEIAASWFPVLGVAGVRGELDKLLMFSRRHGAARRYRTLQDMVAWSHNLLDKPDQIVFRRLAAFTGTFTLDAAVALAGPDGDRWGVLNAIGRLIDKSLIAVEGLEPPRYRLLETLRMFAAQKLDASGETDRVFEREAHYLVGLFRQPESAGNTMPVADWVEQFAPELENIRKTIAWALAERDRAPLAVALVAASSQLFRRLNLTAEGRRLVEQAVELIEDGTPPGIAAQLLRSAGQSWANEDPRRSLPLLQRAADLFLQLQDLVSFANTSTNLGSMQSSLGYYDEARRSFEKAHEILTQAGRVRDVLFTSYGLGLVAVATKDLAGARQNFADAFERACDEKDDFLKQYVLLAMAEVDFMEQRLAEGTERMHGIVDRLRLLQPRLILHVALLKLGTFLLAQGRLWEACRCTIEALAEVRDGDNYIRQLCLQQLALLGALAGRLPEAARLLGYVDAGVPNANDDERTAANYVHRRLLRLLEDGLQHAQLLAYVAEGATWGEDQAVACAKTRLIPKLGEDVLGRLDSASFLNR